MFTDAKNASALGGQVGGPTIEAWLEAHFERAGPGDYIGILAYIDHDAEHVALLQKIRARIMKHKKLATVLGFGPRFLHSTGQAYKGGPNSGVFLEITAKPALNTPVPGYGYGFGDVEAAQGRGDFEAMAERGRRLLRLDLGQDIPGGLQRLAQAIDQVMA